MLARLRPIYEKLALPFGKASVRLGLTPDLWTLFSLIAAVLAGILLARGLLLSGIVLIVVMNVADMIDGATARARGISSPFGSVFDHVLDRYGEFVIFTGLLLGGRISPPAAMFATSGMIMASYVRAKAESVGGVKECTVGWAGRQEKLILLYLGLVLALFGIPSVLEYTAWLIGLISHWTMVQRLLYTRQQILGQSRTVRD